MKKIAKSIAFLSLVTLFVIGVAATAMGATWTPSYNTGTTQHFRSVSFADADHGWAVATSGKVVSTTDGGTTWSSRVVGGYDDHDSVEAIDTSTVVIAAAYGVLRSNDGGQTWFSRMPIAYPRGTSFVDRNNGWVVGKGAIAKTTDGGNTWTTQYPGRPDWLQDVSFVDVNNGWAVGGWQDNSCILHTSNGGATWETQYVGSFEGWLKGVEFLDINNGWAVGDKGTILRTTNGGATWTRQVSNTTSMLEDVSFTDSEHGLVGGYSGILATTNGGASWTFQYSGGNVYGVDLVDNSRAWAAGMVWGSTGGVVLRGILAPTTTLATDPTSPDGDDGWFRSSPSCMLTSNEPGTTFYSWDSPTGPWTTYSSPFFAPSGQHTLYYYSTSNGGWVEQVKSQIIKVDASIPSTYVRLNGWNQNDGWYASNVDVTLAAIDSTAGSGIAATEYSFDGAAWNTYDSTVTVSSEGTTTVYYRSRDAAGNVEAAKQVTFVVDKTMPVTSSEVTGTVGQNGWYVSDVVLSLAAADTGSSGLARTEYSLGDHTYAGSVTMSTEGTNVVSYRSFDRAGNREVVHLETVKIDKTPTFTAIKARGDIRDDGTYSSDVEVTLIADDAAGGSGIDRTEYSFDGQTWSTYAGSFVVSAAGSTTVFYRSVDIAGNVETGGQRTVTIDRVSP